MRKCAATVLAAAFVGGAYIKATAAEDGTAGRPERITLIGCVAQAADGAFRLTNATLAPTGRRSNGVTSAKASAPIGQSAPPDRPRTSGTTTPKGSTPTSIAPVRLESSVTTGVYSAKASAPVRRAQTSVYALDAEAVSAHAGQLVEIAGALQPQNVLKVETIRPLAATCTP